MNANELFTALFWLVAIGYLAYLAWFVYTSITERTRDR
jgi:hypothetical protein